MSETGEGVLVRRRRSPAEAARLVAEYETSGLTRQAFCVGRGLSVATLDKYRRRHGAKTTPEPSRMVAVELLPAAMRSASSSALWLELANGWRIAVSSGFDAPTLKRLLAVVEPA